MLSRLRKNTQSCLVDTLVQLENSFTVANEWWNGEGIDFIIDEGTKREKKFSLSMDEISIVVGIAKTFGMYDKKKVKEIREELLK